MALSAKVAIVADMPGKTSLNSGVLRIMPIEGIQPQISLLGDSVGGVLELVQLQKRRKQHNRSSVSGDFCRVPLCIPELCGARSNRRLSR